MFYKYFSILRLTLFEERLKETWRSPVYGFFRRNVEIGYQDGRKYHYFNCAAPKCKSNGGVRRYQDSQDRAATGNLKIHAIKCFGRDVVNAAFGDPAKSGAPNGSVFAAFARQGQHPVTVSHRAHTTYEIRYVLLASTLFLLRLFMAELTSRVGVPKAIDQ